MTIGVVQVRKIAYVLSLVPHVLILTLMVSETMHGDGPSRGFAALTGLFEVRVAPSALIFAVALRWTRWQHLCRVLIAGTLTGTAVVAAAMFVVGSGVLFT